MTQDLRHADQSNHYPYCKSQPTKWWHRIDWSQVFLDGLLLIVGIRLAYIYSGQLNQMIESNRISRQNFDMRERPWVGIDSVELVKQEVLGSKEERPKLVWTFFANIKNYGSTPAKDVVVQPDQIEGRNTPLMWDSSRACEIAKARSDAKKDTKVVFPGNTLHEREMGATFALNLSHVVVICIAYHDLSDKPHHTRFIYYGVPVQPPEILQSFPNYDILKSELRLRDTQAD